VDTVEIKTEIVIVIGTEIATEIGIEIGKRVNEEVGADPKMITEIATNEVILDRGIRDREVVGMIEVVEMIRKVERVDGGNHLYFGTFLLQDSSM
jgi:hypothetical protein